MRRRKLDITGALLLLFVGYCHADVWAEEPFLEALTKHENVTWVTCDLEEGCATVYLKENTEDKVELLRLNSDKELEMVLNSNTIGLKIEVDDNNPRYFLSASQPGDYEAAIKIFVITFSRIDVTKFFTATIILENVNDNPPIIAPTSGRCEYEEVDTGPTECTFLITDYDGSACYAEMSVSDDHFQLTMIGKSDNCMEATYRLDVVKPLDYETYRLHSMEIKAVDRGQIGDNNFLKPEMTFEEIISYVVNVLDIPDEAPVWTTLIPSISMNEKEEYTETYNAIDGDYGLNWPIEYSLETDTDYFKIDKNTGKLSISEIDRDELQREIFNLKITAVEVPPESWSGYEAKSVDANIVVLVNDKNDHVPTFEPSEDYVVTVDEEQPFSKEIKIVKDPDLGAHGTFNIFIGNNDFSNNFIIVPSTGYQTASLTLTALDPSKMDYEDPKWRTITLEITALEQADETHFSVAKVEINLNNLNDETPEFSEDPYTWSVEENRPKDYFIGEVLAIDPDEDDSVTYTIRGDLLQISSETGEVTTKDELTFDYERQTQVIVQVIASDQATPPHQAVSDIVINVIDLNDEAPVLDIKADDVGEIPEHSKKGTRASPDITATDPDKTAELKITIDWEKSTAYKRSLPVDESLFKDTLELIVDKDDPGITYVIVNDEDRFDWEKFEEVRLRIQVEDTKTHEDYLHNKYAYATLFIYVGDINDNEPIFTEKLSTLHVAENEEMSPRLLGTVLAVDLDGPDHNRIKYSVEPVSPKELISFPAHITIDEDSGSIYTTEHSFDCEQFRQLKYEYIVYATDGKFTNDHQLIIEIADVNDNVPEYENDPGTIELFFEEKRDVKEQLICLDSIDYDMTDPFNHITHIVETHQNHFQMEEKCLYVVDGLDLDREDEKGPVRIVTVSMRDNFKEFIKVNSHEGDPIDITITLTDINDNYPKFPTLENTTRVETLKANAEMFSVEVVDPDDGENGTISCVEEPIVKVEYPEDRDMESVQDLFRVETHIETKTCTLKCNKDLEGFWGRYIITLQAFDLGDPPNPGSGTYFLHISSVNFNPPVIKYPEDGETIRMYRDAEDTSPLQDYFGEPIPDFYVEDLDDPESDNGRVTLTMTLVCDTCTYETYFTLVRIDSKRYRLRKLSSPLESERSIIANLRATDSGTPTLAPHLVSFKISLFDHGSVPQFDFPTATAQFNENATGMGQSYRIPEAKNLQEEELSDKTPVYYHIIPLTTEEEEEEEEEDLFKIDCYFGILTLKSELDYEKKKFHEVMVAATHDENNCGTTNSVDKPGSKLRIYIEVIDENDEPPRFVEDPFTGVFRVSDEPGNVVTTILAIDPDTNDVVNYEYVPGTIEATSGLGQFASDDAFRVEKLSGEVKLNFAPSGRDLSGMFKFQVIAYDSEGKDNEDHRDYSNVQVFIVSEKHQVEFHFYDEVDAVREKENEVANALSDVLELKCTIEKIQMATGNDGANTDMLTHFIDLNVGSPVDGNIVASKFLEGETYSKLTLAMTNLQLSLSSISKPTEDEEDGITLTIVLAAVCAVLGVLVIVFSLAFIVRTRTLNQRLEKLTQKKFGSQDSGLNREGLAVPGTNRHALEGSNPVWNHEVDPGYDATSQSSGDSDLVGIEDSPEFGGSGENQGFGNPAFRNDPEAGGELSAPPMHFDSTARRTSINPLAAGASVAGEDDPYGFSQPLEGGDMDVPRRFSINPLAGGGDFAMDFGDEDEDDGDGAISSRSSATEPTTEL